MTRKGPERWRAWTAAGLVAAVGVTVLAWPEDEPVPVITAPQAPAPAPTSEPVPLPAPKPLPMIDRAALIDAAALAASAFAAGRPVEEGVPALPGRRFRLVLPFGCGGPDDGEGELANGWRYDAARSTLRVAVTPVLLDGPPLSRRHEGFPIATPWLREPVCPALPAVSPAEPDDDAPAAPLAIVRLTDPDAPRKGRREGAAYRLSVRVDPAVAPGAQGLRLVIEGRFEAGDQPPVACTADNAAQRPSCVFAAWFDRIAITSADGKTVHGQWVE